MYWRVTQATFAAVCGCLRCSALSVPRTTKLSGNTPSLHSNSLQTGIIIVVMLWLHCCHGIIHCVSKKRYWYCTLYNFISHQPILVICGRNVAIKRLFIILPLLTNVSTLPGEIWIPEMVFSMSCLENVGASSCYVVDTHQPIVIILCRQ